MIFRRAIHLFFAASTVAVLTGCGLGKLPNITPPPPPISVLFLGGPPSSMAVNASIEISAGVVNDNLSLVTWSVTCGSAGACGTFNYNPTPSSSPVTYTAPSAIPTGNTVTITATSVVDTTKSVSATVTIVPPIPITVSFFAPVPASLEVSSTVNLSASIVNDVSANPEVQWTVTCGSAACGSFNPTATTSEGGTTYTAPSAIPTGNSVTVTATSLTDSTKSASATIIITAAGPTLANGTYVFQLSGSPGSNANFTTGVLVAQNGAITSGEQDNISFNGNTYPYAQFQQISSGSYTTAADGSLQITLNFGPGETETLSGILAPSSKGFVTQIYGSLGSGTLDLQTSTAAPTGGYAFSTYGADSYGDPAWIGGVLNIDGTSTLSGAGSVLDVDDPGIATGEDTLEASTVSAPDKFGRVEFQLSPGTSVLLPSLYLVGYIVDATHIRLVETGGDNFLGAQGGLALGQGASTGHFDSSSLANSSYVFGLSGFDTQGVLEIAGVLSANTSGGVTGTLNWNDLSVTQAHPIPFTGTYTVDPTGRVTLSNLTDGSTFNYSLHLYLTGSGGGLLISNDTSDTSAGQAFQQQTGTFSAVSFTGSYGLNAGETTSTTYGASPLLASVTSVASSTTDTLTGFADLNSLAADFALSGNFTAAANGVFPGTLTGLTAAAPTTPNNFTLYLVNSTQAVAIETDNTRLILGNVGLQ